VPIERGNSTYHYGANGELPVAKVSRAELLKIVSQMESASRQYSSAEMEKATGIFRDSLKNLDSEKEPAGNLVQSDKSSVCVCVFLQSSAFILIYLKFLKYSNFDKYLKAKALASMSTRAI